MNYSYQTTKILQTNTSAQPMSLSKQIVKHPQIMRQIRLLAIKLGACLALAGLVAVNSEKVNASVFNYNQLEVSVTPDAIDGADPTLSLTGSYQITEEINIIGEYSRATLAEHRDVDLDFVNFSIGAAYHLTIVEKTDLIANAKYINTELVISDSSRSASLGEGSGFGFGLGIRHQVTEQVEASASLDYMAVEEATDLSILFGGHYHFNRRFSAGMGYTTGDFDGVTGSLRMSF